MSDPKDKKLSVGFFIKRMSSYEMVNWSMLCFVFVCVLGVAGMAITFAVMNVDWIVLGIAIFMVVVDVSISLFLIWSYFDMQRANLKALKKFYERQRDKL